MDVYTPGRFGRSVLDLAAANGRLSAQRLAYSFCGSILGSGQAFCRDDDFARGGDAAPIREEPSSISLQLFDSWLLVVVAFIASMAAWQAAPVTRCSSYAAGINGYAGKAALRAMLVRYIRSGDH